MLTFLFWNIQKKPLLDRAARLASLHAVDVLILAECPSRPPDVLSALNTPGSTTWSSPPSLVPRVPVFTRLPPASMAEVFSDASSRMTIREITPAAAPPLFLVAVHLPSKFGGWTADSQASLARDLLEDLERIARISGECGERSWSVT